MNDVDGALEAAIRGLKLPYHTASEIGAMNPAEPDWLVRGFVATQAITEIDGKIKAAGKTTFALHLVGAVLTGQPFMGYATSPSKVVYLTEQQPGPFREALDRAGLLRQGRDLRIIFRREVTHLAWLELVAAVVADATHDGYALLVIDTLGKLAGIREENDSGEAAAAMAPLQNAAHDGRAVIVVRHERKGGGEVGESGRGSSAFSGDADIILRIRRPEGNQPSNRRVIESLSRYVETPEQVVVELTDEGYVLLGEEQAVALAEAVRILSAHLKGMRLVGMNGGPTTDELVEACELPRGTVQRGLRELRTRGELVESGRGVKGDPRRFALVASLGKDDSDQTQIPSRAEWNSGIPA